MKAKSFYLILFTMLLSFGSIAQDSILEKSNVAIQDFKNDDASMVILFNSAYGYAVFPKIGKGGLGIGGATGRGTVFKQGTPIADCKMTQLTIGLQAGGQQYAEIIFFEDAKAFDRFVANKFEFAAQVSAVAIKSGASEDAKYREGMMVFTRTNGGLMYEASVGGQKFKTKMY